MKKIILLTVLLLSFTANAVSRDLFEQVIIANVEQSINSARGISDSIEKNKIKQAQVLFTQLIVNWKKVQATYVLGDLNEDFLDTPRYIDIFHGNNEDIKTQLDLIISVTDDVEYALYKHSHKTINALEYLLFTQDFTNDRIKAMALIMTKSIQSYLNQIKTAYQKYRVKFIQDEQFSSAILLNTLVSGTYALKEWRIGDVAGMSKKHKGEADASRGEYALSKNSVAAILAILQAHKQVIDSPKYKDFGDIAIKFGATQEINKTIGYLNQAINQAMQMQEQDLSDAKGKDLYKSTSQLMQSYYSSLMNKLGFVSQVLDADGD